METKSVKPCNPRTQQRGAVAIIVALSLFVLMGFAGLVLDLGRMYVNKTELQSAADACALAAANELVCDPTLGVCPAAFLQNAEAAGIFVAGRNQRDFQGSQVSIPASDVLFSTTLDGTYLTRSASPSPDSKFAMCRSRSTGLVPWFMQVLGFGSQTVAAQAVATLAPGQTACTTAPIGICRQAAAPSYGYSVGQWIYSDFNNNGAGSGDDPALAGNFRWVDFTPNDGGTNQVREQLLGRGNACGLRVGDDIREQGEKQGAKTAWNTRFGLYPNGANAETPATAPPDKTGYSYPSTAIPVGTSAYQDYRTKQASNTPFARSQYAPQGAAGNIAGNPITLQEHITFGSERRLLPVPILTCGQNSSVAVEALGCVLMLNPMSQGNTGTLYLEWRGLASDPSSPCRTAGVAGGATGGALVPTLVQ